MEYNQQLIFLLCLLTFKTGLSAEISVFVQTGKSVQLDLQKQDLPKEFDDLTWVNEKLEIIIKYNIKYKDVARLHPSYKDRVDFNNQSFSLTLKNMQKTDSGLYRARTIGDNYKDVMYRVSVLDPVYPPHLTVNSNSASSDSCTVNFTCSTHELTINSSFQNNSYQNSSCSTEKTTLKKIFTLTLYCSEEFIFCNYSNLVSWEQNKTEIKPLCVKKDNAPKIFQSYVYPINAFIVVGVVVVVLCVLVALFFRHKKRKKGCQEVHNTVYSQVEGQPMQGQQMQTMNCDMHTYDVPERVHAQAQQETTIDKPSTTYCTVGQFQKPTTPTETDHTIYSQVFKQPPKKQNKTS